MWQCLVSSGLSALHSFLCGLFFFEFPLRFKFLFSGKSSIGPRANDRFQFVRNLNTSCLHQLGDTQISSFHPSMIMWATLIISISWHLSILYTSGIIPNILSMFTNLIIKLVLIGRKYYFMHLTDKCFDVGSKLPIQTWCSVVTDVWEANTACCEESFWKN